MEHLPSSKDVSEKGSVDVESTSAQSDNGIDPVAEKKLLRKLDWILLPLTTLIYVLNFVDRTAIGEPTFLRHLFGSLHDLGNAKVVGLEKDLGMTGYDYNVSLTVFFIFFIFFEVPANLALKRFGSISMALLIIMFGLVSIGTAFIQNFAGLIVTRIFLGIAEGGTLPGLTYILSRYYRRHELVLRIGIFFGLAPCIAGAFGGLLASGLLAVNDIGSVTSWRKIFLIEGIITTGFGILGIFFIPTDPKHTRMLNETERELALRRIDADRPVKTHGDKEKTTWKLVWRSLNFNTLLCSMLYLFVNISFQGLSFFMPTVVAGLGHYTPVQVQLRTVPPYAVAGFWALFVTYGGYRLRVRSLTILFTIPLVLSGYVIAVATPSHHARYAACFLCVMGLVPTAPAIVAWGTDNASPDTMRATTSALIPSIGTIGAIVAVWTYLPTDAPSFRKGSILNVATSSTVIVLVIIGALYIRWENGKRERGERNYRLEGKTTQEIVDLGYKHPDFRYQI
ncbi:MFS general substrate transporter [Mucidula mucida]|nr:MFS general substrate transporter [Mucidula mucida]